MRRKVMRSGGLAVLLSAAWTAWAGLRVQEAEDGSFAILRDGVAVVTGIRPLMDREAPCEKSHAVAKDGSRVWNRWNASDADNFRFELVERADGAVEISMLGVSNGPVSNRRRTIALTLPQEVFGGRPFTKRTPYKQYSGTQTLTFEAGLKDVPTRYFASEGLVFNGDPNPAGVYDYNSAVGMAGEWRISDGGNGGFDVRGVAILPANGCTEAGQKMVIHEGTYADYAKDHFLPFFNIYWDRWYPLHHVTFGAPKAGSGCKPGNVAFDGTFGWLGGKPRKVAVGHPSGLYYSHATGRGTSVYRFGKLHPGHYILTLQLGNYTGTSNAFSVSANGEPLVTGVTVGAREARTVARAFHVSDGSLDIAFSGDWIVSAIGLQPLLADAEDFMMRRGFWYSEGYEASIQRRNAYTRPCRRATLDQTMAMPEPGRETAAAYREPPREVEQVDRAAPENRWMYCLSMRNVNLGNGALFYADARKRDAFLDESKALGHNALMLHGNICRHNMAEPYRETLEREIRQLVDGAHARGIKFIDHIDVTLGWAVEYGFRALMENLDCAMLDFHDNLPTFLYCFENPRWKARFYGYLRQQAEAGVDGFQLDELMYWRHGCGCGHCRARFAAETGWSFPLDETDPSCRYAAKTRLGERWRAWQGATVTNWRIGLRRHLKDVNPNLYMSDYTVYQHQVGRTSRLGAMMESARTMSMLGTEVMQHDVMRCARPLMTLARVKNVFRLAAGVPSWNWFYNSCYANEVFAFAVCSMTGEVPLLTGAWLGATYDPAFANPVEWAARSRPMDIAGAFPVAEVGLLLSHQSFVNNEGDDATPELLGLAQELETMHVPYEFFGDVSCRYEQLRNYKVVFLGESQCLSDEEIRALQTFRACGGRVYGRPGCGSRNEFGERRAKPFAGFVEMPTAKPFFEDEFPVRGNDKAPRLTCDAVAERAFRERVAGLVAGATWWTVEGAPDKLYTSVFREASGDVVIHFLNATGCDLWRDGQFVALKSKARFPELKEDVFVDVPASVGDRAVALGPELGFGEVPLEAERKGGRLRVRIPREILRVYAILRFRQATQTGN